MAGPPIDDTIAAIATAGGASALAIVRLSGPDAAAIADRVFRGRARLGEIGTFRGAHGTIVDGQETLDEVVAWVYRAPETATGEDLIEISCHGGASPHRVLDSLVRQGARPAGPGEFTRRAFLNGRLDLAQAEGVAALIAAEGRVAERQALAQLSGGLSRRIRAIADPVRAVLARLTVFLDFEEDEPGPPDVPALRRQLDGATMGLRGLLATRAAGARVRDGVSIALAGRPNVGKSSLLNALAGHDRAIVHAEPGTTRDPVDVRMEWAGLALRLVDTAGIRDADGTVEREGIRRSRLEIGRADVVFWVVDGSAAPTEDDGLIGAGLEPNRTLLILNKADLGPADRGWANVHSPKERHGVSALSGFGVPELLDAVVARLLGGARPDAGREDAWVTQARHGALLEEAEAALIRAEEALVGGVPVELAAADLHRALDALGRITGERAGPELLDEIFRTFCIGK